MHCPFCGEIDTKVTDSRLVSEGKQVRRRRECLACGERFTTFEMADLIMPRVIKRNGTSQPFDEEKLRTSMKIAIQKCSVSMEQLEEAIQRISHSIRTTGERELPSRTIGEMVMEGLRNLDQVAYVRFASVYRSFQDVAAFNTEIKKLQKDTRERERGEN